MEIKNGVIGVSGITDVSSDVTLIKGYTDTEIATILTETNKIPATITKIDSLETKTTFPTKNLATNATIAQTVGGKTDDENGNSLYSKSYIIDKHFHTRSETYPYKANAIPILGGTGA